MPMSFMLVKEVLFDPVQEYQARVQDVIEHGVVYGVREGAVTYDMVREWGLVAVQIGALSIYQAYLSTKGDDHEWST